MFGREKRAGAYTEEGGFTNAFAFPPQVHSVLRTGTGWCRRHRRGTMAPTEHELHCRDEALARLDHFARCVLPCTVRRIAAWKKIPPGELLDLQLELRQELAVDCLEHPAAVLALSTPARHSRWMRLVERWVYRNRVNPARNRTASDPDDEPAPPAPPPDPPGDLGVVLLRNGRCNIAASARQKGERLRDVLARVERFARHLGNGREQVAFWRQRVGEALTGLAADLLLDRGAVHVLPARRRRPDPLGRLSRLRRLGARFHVLPSTRDVRLALAPWVRRARFCPGTPRRLLEHAAALCPQQAPAWLWLFEACLAEGDLAYASRALRLGRSRARLPAHAAVLARGRLLQARGRHRAALALLQRAAFRWPRQSRLRCALAAIGEVPGR